MYTEFKEDEVMTVDLHKMNVQYAKQYLEWTVSMASEEIREIIVIHGYRRGNALSSMVRHNFDSKRVSRKYLSLNPGVTSLILR